MSIPTSIIVASLVLLGSGTLWAADEAPKQGKKDPAAAEAAAPLTGVVVSCAEGQLVVNIGKGKKAAPRTLTIDDKTTVTIDGKPGILADLKPSVAVELTLEGERIVAVKVLPEAKKKDKKDKKDKKEKKDGQE